MSKTLDYIVSRLGDAAGRPEVSTSLLYDAKREVDARIAELTAEVARYKTALDAIAKYDDHGMPIGANADYLTRIARNALKEVV